jgi:two-component system chemotaxis response regulator CheY
MTEPGVHPIDSRSTILVVEDDHDIRVAVRRLLEDEGYEVLTATNGRSALDLLEVLPETPSLILLDLMLPIMDGWHFAEELRLRPRLAEIPIAVMSAYQHLPRPDGIVEFIPKPVNDTRLLRLVAAHCD